MLWLNFSWAGQAVDAAIELTLTQRRVRIYGGFVLAAGGEIGMPPTCHLTCSSKAADGYHPVYLLK
jgi:hypothetical protein